MISPTNATGKIMLGGQKTVRKKKKKPESRGYWEEVAADVL